MRTNAAAIDPGELLKAAQDPDKTPFDYVVVGSGAGGGSMAARLALEGRRVLVIEAGVDPATGNNLEDPTAAPIDPGPHGVREVYAVPAFNAASTEKPDISWEFSVRHFADDACQSHDEKYERQRDPSFENRGAPKGGIFYPRASALGGCTAHHAMIVVRPNDGDWDRIAENTGDETWRSENMEGYFAKLEDCLYYKVYRGFFGRLRGLIALIDPRPQLESGGHGSAGWQKTSFIHPLLILGIVIRDCTFLRVLLGAMRFALADKDERRRLLRAVLHFEPVQVLDPNVRSPDFPTRNSRLSLIPIGTDGACRTGLREHLLDVAKKFPDRLVLATGVHATRVVFDKHHAEAPRAVGVEVAEGLHLYGASPCSPSSKPAGRRQYFARREVILCGGTFNTPQLLMLSGIGDRKHLEAKGIRPCDRDGKPVAPVVNLPSVGSNLQDRYEVSVISETKQPFSVLDKASFRPDDPNDPVLEEWECAKTGLYTTNGGALAMMLSSEANPRGPAEPDLFLFGVPAAFRGYYWHWSEELLRRTRGAPTEQRNLWTWLILKAYTNNNRGTVRLVSDDPFAPPEILFNSFPQGKESEQDIAALCEGVRRAREINARISAIHKEIQPGSDKPEGSKALAKWVQDEAWGHHACGTCRIGSDPWKANVKELSDRKAVLDSRFRVHGVRGLRVVDASVFPSIPGYFIVSSVFMIGEKAADTLLADSTSYPSALEGAEAAAIHVRRSAAGLEVAAAPGPKLPDNTVGLALSGGGIRSATFCLGVLQALSVRNRLGEIDVLSTVSGGGFAGGFLGRLFTRLGDDVNHRVERVQAILFDKRSPEVWWLRKNADYIASAGIADVETNVAILARNLAAVHFFIGALLFAAFGILRCVADWSQGWLAGYGLSLPTWKLWQNIDYSFWWWLPFAVLCFGVVPLAVGYWLTPSAGRRYPALPLLLWLALLGSAVYGLSVPGATLWSGLAIGALLIAWLMQEVARSRLAYPDRGAPANAAADGAPDSVPNTLVRNRLARSLGVMLLALAVSILWVLLDSLARAAAEKPATMWVMVGSAPLVLLLRYAAVVSLKAGLGEAAVQWYEWARKAIVAGLAFLLAATLMLFLDVLVHLVFKQPGTPLGVWIVVTALGGSLLVRQWFGFLNLSSLQQAYGQKLVRTFLGASNDARVHPSGTEDPIAVEIPSAGDDVFFDEYHPERNGGPLHLINACVNDTVAGSSGRQLRDDKGLPMCVGPEGLSVGRKYHALWQGRESDLSTDRLIVRPLPVAPDPNAFHLLAQSDNKNPKVERLRLGQWLGISGAAVATGTGRFTSVPQSLLLGLLNIRLGYWWDSGIGASKRPGRYPPSLWRRLKSAPAWVFPMQATLLNEWRGFFPGPAEQLWYLTDGGHFDNTGLYELFRRRLPFIIAVDGGEDQQYKFDDLAILTRQVRLDFGAEIEWLEPRRQVIADVPMPAWIKSFFDPNAIGALSDLKREGCYCSALARVRYDAKNWKDHQGKQSWLLLLKANLAPPLPVDVRNYATRHATFPNESTADQFFRDDQWESYRALGQSAGEIVFRERSARSAPSRIIPIAKPIEVKKLSWWDTLRVQLLLSIPTFLLGVVAAHRWCLWLFSRYGAGRRTVRLLRELREKYGSDHLWLWFPMRRTLLVLAPETMEAVLVSDENAADPLLKKRALSRFIPDALVISSGGEWRNRRHFNEDALDSENRLHRHSQAFTQIVVQETNRLPGPAYDGLPAYELCWSDFRSLGERISQQVVLGAGRLSPEIATQLARLVRSSNVLLRHAGAFSAFYGRIEAELAATAPETPCLMGDSSTALNRRGATDCSTRVPAQIGFWFFVLKDALALHVARTLALIAAHPNVQQRICQDVSRLAALTPADIDGLRYLEACIHEQLRLWPPVPMLMRRATRSFSLRDQIALEAGQQLLLHAGLYHRDPKIFGEFADRFAPDAALAQGFPVTYFFSRYRQSCAGRLLITFLLKATLASLLARFRFGFTLRGPPIDPCFIPYLYDHFSLRLESNEVDHAAGARPVEKQ
jgi:choline dehydrogenase-like flavoprotein